MDIKKLNSIAGYTERKCKPISELVVNQAYVIEAIKRVTMKYGDKVVIDLQDNAYCYLPARICKELLRNDQQGLIEFGEQLEVSNVSIKRLSGRSNPVEFDSARRRYRLFC